MIAISSQIRSASVMMWVEKMIVLPFDFRSSTIRSTSRAPITSSPDVGSSKINTGGSWSTTRQSERRCFIPVDILPTRLSRKSASWKETCNSAMRPAMEAGDIPASSPK